MSGGGQTKGGVAGGGVDRGRGLVHPPTTAGNCHRYHSPSSRRCRSLPPLGGGGGGVRGAGNGALPFTSALHTPPHHPLSTPSFNPPPAGPGFFSYQRPRGGHSARYSKAAAKKPLVAKKFSASNEVEPDAMMKLTMGEGGRCGLGLGEDAGRRARGCVGVRDARFLTISPLPPLSSQARRPPAARAPKGS